MARLLLHVGTHKTGTTWVQDMLHANRAWLARHGVIYPDLGRHTGHHGLLTDWLALPAAYRLPGGGLGTLRALADTVARTDHTLILSSEEFSRGGGPGGQVDMAALRAALSAFARVEVVCVLRPQWQFLQSVYLEVARDRVPPRPPDLVAQALGSGMVDGLWCDYARLHDHLRQGFAAEEIRLVDYAAALAAPGGVLGRILQRAGLPADPPGLRRTGDGRANVSPRPLPAWAALTIAGGTPAGPALRCAAQEAFDIEFGADAASCIFTRAELNTLAKHFAPRNAALAQAVRPVQPDFAPSWLEAGPIPGPIPGPGPDTVMRGAIGAEYWLRAARRLHFGQARAEAGTRARAC